MKNKIAALLTDPAVMHIYGAILMQSLLAVPLAMLGYESVYFWAALFLSGVYWGRERRQAETGAGSNRIWPWDWSGNPDGPRQALVPTGAMIINGWAMTWWVF